MIVIRNEVGNGATTAMVPLPLSATKMRSLLQVVSRCVTDSYLQRLVTGPSIESKYSTSGEFDQLG